MGREELDAVQAEMPFDRSMFQDQPEFDGFAGRGDMDR